MTVRIVRGVEGARSATGDVVIIDVIRAFTTAAFAFNAGIEEIELVSTVEEAMARPGFRLGEVGGKLIPGFDHNNSPHGLIGRRLAGRAVQRTGSGTQGVVNAVNAESIWLGSLVVASATARVLRGRNVTLVAMGAPPAEPGEDDDACARYLEALLLDRTPPRDEVIAAVRNSAGAKMHRAGDPDRPLEDIDCCVDIDRFGFAMSVQRGVARRFTGAARP